MRLGTTFRMERSGRGDLAYGRRHRDAGGAQGQAGGGARRGPDDEALTVEFDLGLAQ